MDIQANLYYHKSADRIIGYADFGGEDNRLEVANKALVFMCQGVSRKWKQPVAYYFCHNACTATDVVRCLQEVLHAATTFGRFDVVATICDMGKNNVKALKAMGASIQTPYFTFGEKNIYTMYDPPHLLKCTVALFRKYSVLLPVEIGGQEQIMEAKFQDIIDAHTTDKNTPFIFQAMRKIKDIHLAPIMQYSMKVCIAAQVMSHTVASFLYILLSRGEMEQRTVATATFVQQVDELFDSFNGSQLTPGDKELKCAISQESKHLSYWERAYQTVKT
ncbi:uncharacterized protein LOC135130289 [Zophobas morio]|uniref:uncharacterized protein LOC135130289 n=1 Tax=Zophobas morio TaxID=2755281 RepID=UPI003083297A